MSDNLRVLQVFIASPSDLVDERRGIKEVVDSINAAFRNEVGLQVQLLGWEDRLPCYGRPQEQINENVDKADLFIGFLWRRWGSATGNPNYSSGFEEEFNRALERRERGGAPEVCLFFKGVDQQSLGDPGDQLRRVLEFRETAEQSKKVLFRIFKDVADWKEQTRELLQRHLLKLLRSTMQAQSKAQPQAPPSDSTEGTATDTTGQKAKSSTSAAKEQAIRIWSDALKPSKEVSFQRFQNLSPLEKLKSAQLGLTAASITNLEIEAQMPWGAPDQPSVQESDLTVLERFLVLRANLVLQFGYQPGWFWLRSETLRVKAVLVYLACSDEYPAVRDSSISYCRKLDLPLHVTFGEKESAIEILCSHSDKNTRKSALEYLAEKGSAIDLPLVEKLRVDPDINCLLTLYLRGHPICQKSALRD